MQLIIFKSLCYLFFLKSLNSSLRWSAGPAGGFSPGFGGPREQGREGLPNPAGQGVAAQRSAPAPTAAGRAAGKPARTRLFVPGECKGRRRPRIKKFQGSWGARGGLLPGVATQGTAAGDLAAQVTAMGTLSQGQGWGRPCPSSCPHATGHPPAQAGLHRGLLGKRGLSNFRGLGREELEGI